MSDFLRHHPKLADIFANAVLVGSTVGSACSALGIVFAAESAHLGDPAAIAAATAFVVLVSSGGVALLQKLDP